MKSEACSARSATRGGRGRPPLPGSVQKGPLPWVHPVSDRSPLTSLSTCVHAKSSDQPPCPHLELLPNRRKDEHWSFPKSRTRGAPKHRLNFTRNGAAPSCGLNLRSCSFDWRLGPGRLDPRRLSHSAPSSAQEKGHQREEISSALSFRMRRLAEHFLVIKKQKPWSRDPSSAPAPQKHFRSVVRTAWT